MTKLQRDLSLYGLTMIAIGSCIGAGIFKTPADVARHVSSGWMALGVWALGGLIALTGALTLAELGGMFPRAGGVYVYLKEGYGDLAAFWYGWAYFTIVNSGALAALTLAFASYVAFLVPLSAGEQTALACAAIATVSAINVFRVKLVELFADVFTGLKLLGIAGIVAVGLWLGAEPVSSAAVSVATPERGTLGAFGLAMVGVFFSYGGWHHASFLSGEARDPQRAIPRAMIVGALVVTVTYVAINVAFLRLLGLDGMASSNSVAADAVSTVLPWGAKAIAVVIATSALGTSLIYTLSAPRIYFAMAQDGLFFAPLARVHPRFHTPVAAVVIQAVWAIALVLLWGTFETVITYVTFTDWIFFTAAACLVLVFRRKRPGAERPYRTLGYPVTPLVFSGVSAFFLVNTLVERPLKAGVTLAILSLGLPFYLYFKRQRARAPTS
jgi:basic amino acid/polyamine antiporter, APA family